VTLMYCWVAVPIIICILETCDTMVREREQHGNDMVNNEVLSLTHNRLLLAALLDMNRDRYNGCTNSIKRSNIRENAGSILSNIGRFLNQVIDNTNKTEQWVVICTQKAHLKAAHAIQYRMRKMAGTHHMVTDSSDRLEHGRIDTFLSSSTEHVFAPASKVPSAVTSVKSWNPTSRGSCWHSTSNVQTLVDSCNEDRGRVSNMHLLQTTWNPNQVENS
jgi:hypothetical protein